MERRTNASICLPHTTQCCCCSSSCHKTETFTPMQNGIINNKIYDIKFLTTRTTPEPKTGSEIQTIPLLLRVDAKASLHARRICVWSVVSAALECDFICDAIIQLALGSGVTQYMYVYKYIFYVRFYDIRFMYLYNIEAIALNKKSTLRIGN